MMTSKFFTVDILSPQKLLGTYKAKHVLLPADQGYIGMGPQHADFMSSLQIGVLSVEPQQGGQAIEMFVTGGFVKACDNKVKILAEILESPDVIDIERARKSFDRAQARLSGQGSEANYSVPRALLSLERAKQRIAFVQK